MEPNVRDLCYAFLWKKFVPRSHSFPRFSMNPTLAVVRCENTIQKKQASGFSRRYVGVVPVYSRIQWTVCQRAPELQPVLYEKAPGRTQPRLTDPPEYPFWGWSCGIVFNGRVYVRRMSMRLCNSSAAELTVLIE